MLQGKWTIHRDAPVKHLQGSGDSNQQMKNLMSRQRWRLIGDEKDKGVQTPKSSPEQQQVNIKAQINSSQQTPNAVKPKDSIKKTKKEQGELVPSSK